MEELRQQKYDTLKLANKTQFMVNNFRPIQATNERLVYRSFVASAANKMAVSLHGLFIALVVLSVRIS